MLILLLQILLQFLFFGVALAQMNSAHKNNDERNKNYKRWSNIMNALLIVILIVNISILCFDAHINNAQTESLNKKNEELNESIQYLKAALNKQLSLQENQLLTEQNIIIVDYNQLISKFTEIVFEDISNKNDFLELSKEQRSKILNHVENIIDDILKNSIVANTDDYFHKWNVFRYFDFANFKSYMEKYETDSTVSANYYGKEITTGKELLSESFEDFRNSFRIILVEISEFSKINQK